MLEGRHVIGLFMLMLLFSGVFFTLGYVMGRNELRWPGARVNKLARLAGFHGVAKAGGCAETLEQKAGT